MSATATSESETGLTEHVGLFGVDSRNWAGPPAEALSPDVTVVDPAEPWCSAFAAMFPWAPRPARAIDAEAAANGMGC